MRESVAECGHSLHSRKCELANAVGLVEAEDTLDLVEIDVLLNLNHVRVQVLNILYI